MRKTESQKGGRGILQVIDRMEDRSWARPARDLSPSTIGFFSCLERKRRVYSFRRPKGAEHMVSPTNYNWGFERPTILSSNTFISALF